MPRHFKVKRGTHKELDGKLYNQGDIVISNKDLLAAFPEKFEEVLAPPSFFQGIPPAPGQGLPAPQPKVPEHNLHAPNLGTPMPNVDGADGSTLLTSPLGTDATSEFADLGLAAAGLAAFKTSVGAGKKAKEAYVLAHADATEIALHDEPLPREEFVKLAADFLAHQKQG